jgi:hypothetical protein
MAANIPERTSGYFQRANLTRYNACPESAGLFVGPLNAVVRFTRRVHRHPEQPTAPAKFAFKVPKPRGTGLIIGGPGQPDKGQS